MFLEKVIQIYPITVIYWLGILFFKKNYVLAKIPIKLTEGEVSFLEIEKAIWRFYDENPNLDPNDRLFSIDTRKDTLIFRRLWIITGLITRSTYRVGESNVGIGFPTNS